MDKQGVDCLIIGGNRDWAEGELANLRYVGAGIDWEPTYVILPKEGLPLYRSRPMQWHRPSSAQAPLNLSMSPHTPDQVRATLRWDEKSVLELDRYCANYTRKISGGATETLFTFQAGEHETTFWHDDIQLQPSNLAYNQPFFHSTQGGTPYHVYGDAVLCQDDAPFRLHKTKWRRSIYESPTRFDRLMATQA